MSVQISQNKLQRTRQLVLDYLGTHSVSENLNRAVNDLCRVRPQDPWLFLSDAVTDWQKCGPLVDRIAALFGVDVYGRLGLQLQLYTRPAVNRPPTLFLTQPVFRSESFFSQAHDEQKSIEAAIADVDQLISRAVHGIGVHDQQKLDEELLNVEFSGENSPYNVLSSVSFLACQAAARSLRQPLFSHIQRVFLPGQTTNDGDTPIPTPMMDVINGGRFGRTGINVLRVMVIPPPAQSPVEQTQLLCSVNLHAKQILFGKYGAGGQVLGLTGGYAPHGCESVNEAIEVVEQALADAGWAEKQENESEESLPTIGLVVGADYIFEDGQYEIEQGKRLTSEELLDFYDRMIEAHPKLSYIEDPFASGDDESWTKFVDKHEGTVSVSGNLYYRCKVEKLEQPKGTMTTVSDLFIQTITSAVQFSQHAIELNQQLVISNCLSSDSALVDLAVAMSASHIQIGGSYNLRLLSRLSEASKIIVDQESASTRVSVSQKDSNPNAETESQQSGDADLLDNELP